jgi:hypothetical protein
VIHPEEGTNISPETLVKPRITPGNKPETFMYNNNHGESLQSHKSGENKH